jgi:hypothetical protein
VHKKEGNRVNGFINIHILNTTIKRRRNRMLSTDLITIRIFKEGKLRQYVFDDLIIFDGLFKEMFLNNKDMKEMKFIAITGGRGVGKSLLAESWVKKDSNVLTLETQNIDMLPLRIREHFKDRVHLEREIYGY